MLFRLATPEGFEPATYGLGNAPLHVESRFRATKTSTATHFVLPGATKARLSYMEPYEAWRMWFGHSWGSVVPRNCAATKRVGSPGRRARSTHSRRWEPRFTSPTQGACDSMRLHACWRRLWQRNPVF